MDVGNTRRLSSSTLACPLSAVAGNGSLLTVRLLIAKGADVDGLLCKGGRTPLVAAAESENPGVVDDILKYHPDVNATGSSGDPALSAFLERSYIDLTRCISSLLSYVPEPT